MASNGMDRPRSPLTVTELTARIKVLLEREFAMLRVCGEVSRLTHHRSGHIYFTIKDEHAAIAAVIWRSTAMRLSTLPKEGESFIFAGDIRVYEPRGSYQLVVRDVQPAGIGRLAEEFERRKRLFAERGWFDAERKRPIPPLPRHIGIVTSLSAAALEDVKKVLASRPGWLQLTISPATVQGEGAAESVVRALRRLAECKPDVILLVRGGGSIEDLWCFNDEHIVRAIVECPIPVITGIGHEIDLTLADLAADRRAATPSNAAEMACPSRESLRQCLPAVTRLRQALQRRLRHERLRLTQMHQALGQWPARTIDRNRMQLADLLQRLQHAQHARLRGHRRRLLGLERQLQRHEPARQLKHRHHRLQQAMLALHSALGASLDHRRRRLALLRERLQRLQWQHIRRHRQRLQRPLQAMQRHGRPDRIRRERVQSQTEMLQHLRQALVANQRQRLQALSQRLKALSPSQVLARGYTISFDAEGRLLRSAAQLAPGQCMRTRFHDGETESRIKRVEVKS